MNLQILLKQSIMLIISPKFRLHECSTYLVKNFTIKVFLHFFSFFYVLIIIGDKSITDKYTVGAS